MDSKSYNIRVPKRWARVAMIVGVAALIIAPLTAVASHVFNDVPDSHTFHNNITWLADAGVTKGCNPPDNTEFCPDDNVTRGQMAAFMQRFAQYIDAEDGTPGLADHAASADSATAAGDADTLNGLTAEDIVDQSPLVLSAANFSPDGFGSDGDASFGWLSGSWTAAADSCLQAPVALPNGSAIDRMRVFVHDADGSSAGATFLTSDYFDGTTDTTPTVSPLAEGNIQALELTDAEDIVIDSSQNHYWIGVCVDSGDSLHAARVDYSVSDASLSSTGEDGTFGLPPESEGDSNQ